MSGQYRDFVMDLLGPMGPVSARSMFGGTGIYYESVMFALIADDRLYFKATDRNRADFEDEGMEPFTYEGADGRRAVMSYWEVPEHLFDEPEELRLWAEKAVAAAVAAKKPPRAPKSRAKAKPKARKPARKPALI
jgi:DNA transformation protein